MDVLRDKWILFRPPRAVCKWRNQHVFDYGRTDLFWYNVNSGEVFAWIIDGASVLQAVSYGTVPPATGWIPAGLEDFNGDGRADLLWYNVFSLPLQ